MFIIWGVGGLVLGGRDYTTPGFISNWWMITPKFNRKKITFSEASRGPMSTPLCRSDPKSKHPPRLRWRSLTRGPKQSWKQICCSFCPGNSKAVLSAIAAMFDWQFIQWIDRDHFYWEHLGILVFTMGFTLPWCHVVLSIAGVGTHGDLANPRTWIQWESFEPNVRCYIWIIWATYGPVWKKRVAQNLPQNVLGKSQFIATSHLIREYGYNSSAHHSLATGNHILLTIHMKSSLWSFITPGFPSFIPCGIPPAFIGLGEKPPMGHMQPTSILAYRIL